MIFFLTRIKNYIKLQQQTFSLLKEIEWAHIYHDSIRGKKHIQELPLNIGRWAGNYTFFYVLNRVLSDYKPKRILELGLGESSKFISTYIENYLHESKHDIVEQDNEWITSFKEKFNLSAQSQIIHCPLHEREIKKQLSYSYQGFLNKVSVNYDLFIIDGPYGSDNYSRYDIVLLAEQFIKDKEFIIIVDDSERPGEQQTVNDLLLVLKNKSITIYTEKYRGKGDLTVIATKKYKFATTL